MTHSVAAATGPSIVLAHGHASGDGFRRLATPGRLELLGDSPRGLLLGAYATLKELGVRWPWPADRSLLGVRPGLDPEELTDAPRLPGRCLVLGERALVERADDWITWAARNRLNRLFVHVSTRSDPIGAAPEAGAQAGGDRAGPRAGMTIEHGGHLLPELAATGRDPHAGRGGAERGGAAQDRTARAGASRGPRPPLWRADRPPGARGEDASNAALRTPNAVAEHARPGSEVPFLAYHDIEEVPRRGAPAGQRRPTLRAARALLRARAHRPRLPPQPALPRAPSRSVDRVWCG
jgi:hypothetical protein